MSSTYHVKLSDGSSSMLEKTGWYPFMTWIVHFGLARRRDGRALFVSFTRMPDGTLAAEPNLSLASRVVTEVPF